MYLYFDKKGTLKELVNDKALRQASQDYNKIYIYVEDLDPATVTGISFRYVLPNNDRFPQASASATPVLKEIPYDSKRDLKFFKYYETYPFFEVPTSFELTDPDTEEVTIYNALDNAGVVSLSIYIDTAEETITLGLIVFNVEESAEGDNYVQADEYISLAQFNFLRNSKAEVDWVESYVSDRAYIIKKTVAALAGTISFTNDEIAMMQNKSNGVILVSVSDGNGTKYPFNLHISRTGIRIFATTPDMFGGGDENYININYDLIVNLTSQTGTFRVHNVKSNREQTYLNWDDYYGDLSDYSVGSVNFATYEPTPQQDVSAVFANGIPDTIYFPYSTGDIFVKSTSSVEYAESYDSMSNLVAIYKKMNQDNFEGYSTPNILVFLSPKNRYYIVATSGGDPFFGDSLVPKSYVDYVDNNKLLVIDSLPVSLGYYQWKVLNSPTSMIKYQNRIYHLAEQTNSSVSVYKAIIGDTISDGVISIQEYRIIKNNGNFSEGEVASYTVYSKLAVDELVADLETREFSVVTELPLTGEEGIIYLLLINPQDQTQGYYQYIWENNAWLMIGTTVIDLSDYYTESEVNSLLDTKQNVIDSSHKIASDLVDDTNQTNKFVSQSQLDKIDATTLAGKGITDAYTKTETGSLLNAKENISNKVTSVGSSSTNTEYPSAKAVYDLSEELRNVAEGKCKTISISYAKTAPTTDVAAQLLKKEDGTEFEDLQDFTDYITVDNTQATLINSSFNSQADFAPNGYCYIITIDGIVLRSWGDGNAYGLKTGDIILIIEIDVPDRWFYDITETFYRLETSKVDITGLIHDDTIAPNYDNTATYAVGNYVIYDNKLYRCTTAVAVAENFDSNKWTEVTVSGDFVTLNTDQTISGIKSFTSRAVFGYGKIVNDANYFKVLGLNDATCFYVNHDWLHTRGIVPLGNNQSDLGSSSLAWKDLYLQGNAKVGEIRPFSASGQIGIRGNVRSAGQPNDIGNATYPFKNLHLSSNLFLGGSLRDGNSSYGLKIPDTTSWTANKTIATTDETFNVINASDIVNNTLTQAQYDLITNGKPTFIKGTWNARTNLIILNCETYSAGLKICQTISNDASNCYIQAAIINESTLNIALQGAQAYKRLRIESVNEFNGKTVPNYPTTNPNRQALTVAANGGVLSWEDLPTTAKTLYRHNVELVHRAGSISSIYYFEIIDDNSADIDSTNVFSRLIPHITGTVDYDYTGTEQVVACFVNLVNSTTVNVKFTINGTVQQLGITAFLSVTDTKTTI